MPPQGDGVGAGSLARYDPGARTTHSLAVDRAIRHLGLRRPPPPVGCAAGRILHLRRTARRDLRARTSASGRGHSPDDHQLPLRSPRSTRPRRRTRRGERLRRRRSPRSHARHHGPRRRRRVHARVECRGPTPPHRPSTAGQRAPRCSGASGRWSPPVPPARSRSCATAVAGAPGPARTAWRTFAPAGRCARAPSSGRPASPSPSSRPSCSSWWRRGGSRSRTRRAPAARILPYGDQITVRQLLDHTGGRAGVRPHSEAVALPRRPLQVLDAAGAGRARRRPAADPRRRQHLVVLEHRLRAGGAHRRGGHRRQPRRRDQAPHPPPAAAARHLLP